jgi:hypothetical protein
MILIASLGRAVLAKQYRSLWRWVFKIKNLAGGLRKTPSKVTRRLKQIGWD